jgi:excisionase family DNA binding protein
MDKICIVKWRNKDSALLHNALTNFDNEIIPMQHSSTIASSVPVNTTQRRERESLRSQDPAINDTNALSIILTPRQCEIFRSNKCFPYLLTRPSSGVGMEMQQGEDGQVIFNFHFKQTLSVKMMKAHEVCQMLQISKGFLQRLVRENHIKSYKIRRLRRFLVEDILNYLIRNELSQEPNTISLELK